ncbi:MAG: glycosyltransferase family 2 protein [Anaerolineaceae bacterium]|nr:glycosyltransferase family 2 protein [Anaerolineaceae bacterium]
MRNTINTNKDNHWHVVVPVYNEAEHLETVLKTLLPLGYSHRVTFVNDASTDSSGKILDTWTSRLKCKVIHLQENQKKEGAIRKVLEKMKNEGTLPEYTILLDADSFLMPNATTVSELIQKAITNMKVNNVAGMAFRIEAIIPPGISPLQRCIYYDYAGVQFDNWLTSKYDQLWVINGPGGIFKSSKLLYSLQSMVPDFETGDLLITVNLMKNNEKVAFWPHLTVKTWVPRNYTEYFQQRRRWERGSIKVLWNEREFYYNKFKKRNILALYTVLYLIYPFGIVVLPLFLFIVDSPINFILQALAWNFPFWVSVTAAKCIWNKWIHEERKLINVLTWASCNGLLFLVATGPARITGFFDALKHIYYNCESKTETKKAEQ